MPHRERFSLNANNIACESRKDSRLEAPADTVLYRGRWQLFPTDIQIAILSQRPKKKERSIDFGALVRGSVVVPSRILCMSHMRGQAQDNGKHDGNDADDKEHGIIS